jgi:trk system potassium uptake protein TrkH
MTALPRTAGQPLLVVLAAIAALAMLLPAAHAATLRDWAVARAFLQAALLLLVVLAMVAMAAAGNRAAHAPRGQLGALVGAYLLLPPVLALPFHAAVPAAGFGAAWFEMIAAFTTTGATLYDAPGALPASVHLWRALVGWMGGLFVLVAAAAILAPLDLGGAEVLTGRVPGSGHGGTGGGRGADTRALLLRHALAILPAYTGLTLALWILLLIAGERGLMALCLALGTLSTSGIVPGGGLAEGIGGVLDEVLIFLFLGVAVTRRALPGTALVDRSRPLWHDHEVQIAAAVLALVTAVLMLRTTVGGIGTDAASDARAALTALWGALFTTLSFLTTTGYESVAWPAARLWSGLEAPGLILAGLAIMGGGVATTAGGLKLLRVYALARHGERELGRMVHPHSVGGGGATERRLRNEGANAAWVFLVLFALGLVVLVGAMALARVPFDRALLFAVAALTSTGPLVIAAPLVPLSWTGLEAPVQAILAAGMVVGRIEVLAVLALVAPGSWRR